MDKDIKKYIIGTNPIPDWVKEFCRVGKIRFNYDEDEFIDVSVSVQSNVVKANNGDLLLKSRSGLIVIPKDKAEMYLPKPNKQNLGKNQED